MTSISDIAKPKLLKSEKLDLMSDSEGYLQELSRNEKINIGGGRCGYMILDNRTYAY